MRRNNTDFLHRGHAPFVGIEFQNDNFVEHASISMEELSITPC